MAITTGGNVIGMSGNSYRRRAGSPNPLGNRKRFVFVGFGLIFALPLLTNCGGEGNGNAAGAATVDTPAVIAPALSKTEVELAEMVDHALSLPVKGGQRAIALRTIIEQGGESEQAILAQGHLDKLLADLAADGEARGKWSYTTVADQLSGKPIKHARLTSENTLNFDFPYAGAQRGTLTIRKHPQHGRDIIVSIERGQMLCAGYADDCAVRIVFDGGKPYEVQGNEPADNSSTAIFLPGYKTLTSRIAKSKEMRISFNAYQEGQPVLIFKTQGFDRKEID